MLKILGEDWIFEWICSLFLDVKLAWCFKHVGWYNYFMDLFIYSDWYRNVYIHLIFIYQDLDLYICRHFMWICFISLVLLSLFFCTVLLYCVCVWCPEVTARTVISPQGSIKYSDWLSDWLKTEEEVKLWDVKSFPFPVIEAEKYWAKTSKASSVTSRDIKRYKQVNNMISGEIQEGRKKGNLGKKCDPHSQIYYYSQRLSTMWNKSCASTMWERLFLGGGSWVFCASGWKKHPGPSRCYQRRVQKPASVSVLAPVAKLCPHICDGTSSAER